MSRNDEREQRYAEAIYQSIVDQPAHMTETGPLIVSGLPMCYAGPMSERAAAAVMAVADAEQSELRAEVERLRGVKNDWRRSWRTENTAHRSAEAKVARVEAVVNDEFGFTYDNIRAALDGE